jgi:hypothetical protein
LSIVIEGSMLLKPYLIMDFPKRLGIHAWLRERIMTQEVGHNHLVDPIMRLID